MSERIWLNRYPSGVPETIDPDEHASLPEFFEKIFQDYASNTAFSSFDVALTYGELDSLSRAFAAFLQQRLGVQKGDRVAIMLPNVLQFPVALFGILRAGAVVVNVNPLYTPPELVHQLSDAQAETIIVMANFAHTLEQAQKHTPIKNIIVTELGDLLGLLKGTAMNFAVKYLKKGVPAYSLPTAIPLKQVIKDGKELALLPVPLHHQDIAFLQYTGGTTGGAKGAVLTQRNMIANVLQVLAWVKGGLKPEEDVVLTALPLYHIFSLTICCLCFLALGSQCLFITNPRDLQGFIKTLRKKSPTVFIGLNTLFKGLLHEEEFCKLDFSRWNLTVAGGMSTQKVVADRWQAVTGLPIVEGYGLTEASPVVAVNPIDIPHFNDSIGLPLPSTEVELRDAQGHRVPLGEPGELCLRGPQVMKGYWKRPAETQAVMPGDGWLHTGDIARMDEQGFLYIVDRKKDMILVSGFNVFPNEVEQVLASHPGVMEVAVVGVPSEQSGETVKAYVVKKDDALTQEDLIAFCHQSLTGYKVPREIEFRDQLPKSPVGKILRRSLK